MRSPTLFHNGLTFLVTLLAIAITASAAMALWSETLSLQGVVETGELDWELVEGTLIYLDSCALAEGNANDYNALLLPEPQLVQVDKDVGCTEAWFEDSDGDGDYDTLIVVIHNAYPYYYTSVSFKVHNNGNIPLKIWRVIIDNQQFFELNEHELRQGVEVDVTGDGQPDLLIWWGDNFGEQLEPGRSANLGFDITVLQSAPESSTLTLTVQLDAIAWNEYESAIPG